MTASSDSDNQDYIIVRHPDASTSTYPFPSEAESLLKIGRELDNDIVLIDPRTSRYHLQMRRRARGGAELMDTDSTNGTMLGATRLSANEWIALGPGQAVQIGDSQIMWDRASSMAQTIGIRPINDPVPAVDSLVASAAPKPKESRSPWPWRVGIGGIVIATLLLVALLAIQFFNTATVTPLVVDAPTTSEQPTPAARAIDAQNQPTPPSTPTTPAIVSADIPIPTATQDVAVIVTNTPTPTLIALADTATLSDTTAFTLGGAESADAETPTPDAKILAEADAPTPTPTTRPVPARPSGLTISPASLVGTIAFGDFNGATYDLYFGDVATGKTIFWRSESSQPAFSHRGDRVTYHSWRSDARGLWTTTLDQRQGYLIGPFLEDQLPAWGPGDAELILLSRRSGTRQSKLFKAPATQERPPDEYLLEGEYPFWHSNDTLVFKGWVTTGIGLQIASGSNVQNYRALTDHDSDTAPHISPDGQKVIFMSQRQGNWDIYVVNLDGSNLTQLTMDEAQDGLPTWSPDGQVIAFVSNRGGSWAVWAMTPRGRGIRQLFTYQGSPDGFVATEPSNDTTRGWAEERISWTQSVLVPQE